MNNKKLSYLFPLAFMVNTFAMTTLLIMLGLAGKSSMAAEVGIIQGATLALFYAFSANARSLILNKVSKISAQSIMASRSVLLIPLAGVAFLLSVSTAGVGQFIAIALILRRCIEWLGEVHLSEMERLDNKEFARKYLILQVILLVIVLVWLLSGFPFPMLGLFIWALTPLILSAGYILKAFVVIPDALSKFSSSILPHLGSTAIIGITVYVFRLLILLILSKEMAGDLFTAFAIGGLTGGVFANALGPSIALHEQRSGKRYFPSMLRAALHLSLVLGVVIITSTFLELQVLDWAGKSYFFWMATGLSMIGGVIMVYAQRIRFRLLQHDVEYDVFGPDVMMNILLITAVPFVYYLLGVEAMGGLYLISSLLAFVFYFSAKKEGGLQQQSQLLAGRVSMVIAFMLLLPVFFQINNGLFRDVSINFSSDGVLTNLPIPLSVIACYVGIVLLGAYKRAFFSFSTIFFTCILMTMAAIISTQHNPVEQQAKLVLLIQFILPMFALVLGQLFHPRKNNSNSAYFAKIFLYVIAIIVPLQLISTWSQGFSFLTPSLWLFSIYQHLEYVPVVFVSAYLIALFALWQLPKHKRLLLTLAPIMAIYVAASVSMLSMGMLFIGLLGFAIFKWVSNAEKFPAMVFLVVTIMSSSYLLYEKEDVTIKFSSISELAINIGEHMDARKYYLAEITTSPKIFFVGHLEAPERNKHPSAYNYYLDFIYNFGLLALIPMLVFLTYTCVLIYRHRRAIYLSPGLIGLCIVTLFLLLIDNSLKVSLRQPYPGIFTFFLWGHLLSCLLDLGNARELENASEV